VSKRESFGAQLHRYRRAAGLSQAELAERAGLSQRGISDLERGARSSPYPATVRRLAAALELSETERAELLEARSGDHVVEPAPELSGPGQLDLPRELNSFVGREHELRELTRRISEAAMVTIAGPGGAGKTRLALHLAHHLVDISAYADGIILIELAPLTEPHQVARTLAENLRLPEPKGQPLIEVLVRALRLKRTLLVLDNCEHLIAASAELASELLRGCPGLGLLATSREPLGVPGEVVYRIPPLRLPVDDGLESLIGSEAGPWFVQRARAANSRFVLTESNAPAIAEICRRLDGLPLAIELAAARVAAFAPLDIAQRLDDAVRIAAAGPRTAALRQQTLEATMAWSYALLDTAERCLFERLAVFAGGFSLEGAHASAPDDIDALEVVSRLVAKSMIQVEPQPEGAVRYRLLEPLRQFARARLEESGELESARRRHAEYMLAVVEAAGGDLSAPGLVVRTERLSPEADNIRVAVEWATENGETHLALRVAGALWMWWSRPDRQRQGLVWLEQILALPDADREPLQRGRVVVGQAFLSLLQGEMAAAARLAGDMRELAQSAGDATLLAVASSVLATAKVYLGESDASEPLLHESIQAARQSGLQWIEVLDLGTLGHMALAQDDLSRAEEYLREGLRIARTGPDPWLTGMALNSIGDLMRARGAGEHAGPAYEEALALYQTLDPQRTYAPPGLLHNLGYVALARGDPRHAAQLFLGSADLYRAVGTDRRGLAECIVGLACTAAQVRQTALAAHLFGSAEATLERLGTLPTTANRKDHERGLAALRSSMDPDQFQAERAAGRDLALDDVLEQARGLPRTAAEVEGTSARRGVASLTSREYEVALLVARGLANRQVAEMLVISEKTAKNHVQRVLDKLAVRSRAEVAARADELGLRNVGSP
jgi:predicted ATPase/DNA-binding CsgD family transcriptional regulator